MRRPVLLAVLCAALALPAHAAALDVGLNDNAGTVGPGSFYGTLQGLGMKTNVIAVHWDPANPLALPGDLGYVRAAAEEARARGIEVVLATHQSSPLGLAQTPNAADVFARWLVGVAEACPICARKVIVLNEPNQPRFFQPVWDAGMPSSPAAYGRVLASAYDALKAHDRSIVVYGIGLSPRGNDKPPPANNASLSPVTFLLELGKAYRASGRRTPLMDGLSVHVYHVDGEPSHVSQKIAQNVGVPDLHRVKQAFHDAFAGTGQPLIGMATTAGVPMRIAVDEAGWQVDTAGLPGYFGAESVTTVTEAQQAGWHADVIARYACDPTVERLNFLHLVDEPNRERWQSGLLRLDGSERPSFGAVRKAIADNRTCRQAPVSWKPATMVLGALAQMPVKRVLNRKQTAIWGPTLKSDEPSLVVGQIQKMRGKAAKGRKLSAAKPVRTVTFRMRPGIPSKARFKGRLQPGTYRFVVRLSATANPSRKSTFTSRTFVVK